MLIEIQFEKFSFELRSSVAQRFLNVPMHSLFQRVEE